MILTITIGINNFFEKKRNYVVIWMYRDLKRKEKISNKIVYIYCYDMHNTFIFISLIIL